MNAPDVQPDPAGEFDRVFEFLYALKLFRDRSPYGMAHPLVLDGAAHHWLRREYVDRHELERREAV